MRNLALLSSLLACCLFIPVPNLSQAQYKPLAVSGNAEIVDLLVTRQKSSISIGSLSQLQIMFWFPIKTEKPHEFYLIRFDRLDPILDNTKRELSVKERLKSFEPLLCET